MDEIRVGKSEYNLDAIRRAKADTIALKEKGLTLIEIDYEKFSQDVIELIQAENENRRMNYEHLDAEIQTYDACLEEYSKLPLKE
jgi:hypothetical protein